MCAWLTFKNGDELLEVSNLEPGMVIAGRYLRQMPQQFDGYAYLFTITDVDANVKAGLPGTIRLNFTDAMNVVPTFMDVQPHDRYWVRSRPPTSRVGSYPHTCPRCGARAYVGFMEIDHADAGYRMSCPGQAR